MFYTIFHHDKIRIDHFLLSSTYHFLKLLVSLIFYLSFCLTHNSFTYDSYTLSFFESFKFFQQKKIHTGHVRRCQSYSECNWKFQIMTPLHNNLQKQIVILKIARQRFRCFLFYFSCLIVLTFFRVKAKFTNFTKIFVNFELFCPDF